MSSAADPLPSVNRYELTYLDGVIDTLSINDHLLVLRPGRIIALTGLARELYAQIECEAQRGRRVSDSRDIVRAVCAHHNALSVPFTSVSVALSELSELDLVRAVIYPEDLQ